MIRLNFLFIILLLFIPPQVHGQKPQWKLTKGDQFAARLIQKTEVATTGGFESQQNSLYDVGTNWKVVEVASDKVATVQITIKTIKVKIDNSMAPTFGVDVDTQRGEPTTQKSQTFLTHMNSLVGKTFLMSVSPSGKIAHLPLPVDTKKTIAAFPKTDYVLQTFDIKSVVQSMTSFFPQFPADLAKAKSWQRASDPKTAANETFVSTTTYAGTQMVDGKALMQFVLETSPKAIGDRKVNKEGREPFVVSKQTGKGISQFDAGLGNFTSSIYRNEIVSSTEFKGTKSGTRIVTDFKVNVDRR